MIRIMKIADKYNSKELFDTMDSQISQDFLLCLNRLDHDKNQKRLERYLKEFEGIQAPKFTAMIYNWRGTENGRNCLDDFKWSSLIHKNPDFAMLGGNIVGRYDYQNWFQQHKSWCLCCKRTNVERNDFAVLVGPIGEIKGAVKCSPI